MEITQAERDALNAFTLEMKSKIRTHANLEAVLDAFQEAGAGKLSPQKEREWAVLQRKRDAAVLTVGVLARLIESATVTGGEPTDPVAANTAAEVAAE